MKLFDIVGGKVVIHSDALGIPCFKKVWDADKADKEHATKVISYIVLKNKWNSPYVLSMDPDSIESKLKEELFDDVNYELSAAEIACEEQFKEFCNTRLLRMLQNRDVSLTVSVITMKNHQVKTQMKRKLRSIQPDLKR